MLRVIRLCFIVIGFLLSYGAGHLSANDCELAERKVYDGDYRIEQYRSLLKELRARVGRDWEPLGKEGNVNLRSHEFLGKEITGISAVGGEPFLYSGRVIRITTRYPNGAPYVRGPFYEVVLIDSLGSRKQVALWGNGDYSFVSKQKADSSQVPPPETRALPEILAEGGWKSFKDVVDATGGIKFEDIKGKEIVGMVREHNHSALVRAKVLDEISFLRFRDLKNKPHPWVSITGKSEYAVELESVEGLIFPFPISAEEGKFYFRDLPAENPYMK